MKKIKIALFLSILSTSSSVYASCTERHTKPESCIPTNVFSISGSNAEKHLKELQNNMSSVGEELSKAVDQTMHDLSVVVEKSTGNIQTTMIEVGQDKLKKEIEVKKMLNERDLTIKLDRQSKEDMKSKTTFFSDDTPQEMKLIVDALKDKENADMTTREIAAMLKEVYDDKEAKIPIPLHGSEETCSEEDYSKGMCSTLKIITPGRKLFAFFNACNEQKKKTVEAETEQKAENAVLVGNSRQVDKSISSTDAVSEMAKDNSEQKELSCNTEQYKNKLCMTDIDKETYQEYVATNVIIRNANVSPTNLLNPTSVGGLGDGLVNSKKDMDVLKHDSLDYKETENIPQNTKEVPIVYTYKNINQLKGAQDFVNNIVGLNLVSNQSPQERKKIQSAEFQSRYNNRIAVLSLVRTAFMDSVKNRTGRFLSEELKKDPLLENIDLLNPVKESVLGAGKLDHLNSRVDDLFKLLDLDGANLKDLVKKEMMNGGNGDKFWPRKQLQIQNLQSEIMLERMIQNEKSLLLKAAQVASKANSVENIIYLKNLRRGN